MTLDVNIDVYPLEVWWGLGREVRVIPCMTAWIHAYSPSTCP